MLLRDCIRRINNALDDIGQKKAYDIKHPHYNRYGYNLLRIAAGTTALGLPDPEDVPAWDLLLERYRPGEFFWKLWAWNMNNQGEPEQELEDHVDDLLGLPMLMEYTHGRTVLGQVTALNKVIA